ncbi:uncharacterized protein EAE98_006224 [Botrytis deweyae]|uniref:Uncharacterized protein n=1 Tax=Botrytis deweyae TaxID=2478750 RepID=A0ABQ7IK98_9HELO|nr:uncharacterized protein EAE98_006224 [Botrytis deweyae]KAF7926839.1 hypothetical protein EAE98_006224 [Botrytis deweyae]
MEVNDVISTPVQAFSTSSSGLSGNLVDDVNTAFMVDNLDLDLPLFQHGPLWLDCHGIELIANATRPPCEIAN